MFNNIKYIWKNEDTKGKILFASFLSLAALYIALQVAYICLRIAGK